MKCLIVDELHDSFRAMFEKVGLEYVYKPELTRGEIISELQGFEILLIRSKTTVDAELIAKADCLKIVARAGAGVDNVDELLLAQKEIALVSAAEGNRDAVAEHTVGMILALLNNFMRADYQVRHFGWHREPNRGFELSSQTVGIIGFGNMGSAVAERLGSFGCKILAYDKFKKGFGNKYVEEVSFETIKENATILTFHIPLLEENKYLVSNTFFDELKKPVWLVNTSRGKVLSLSSLLKAYAKGQVKGAALDVLENEKIDELTDEELRIFEEIRRNHDLLLTPHIAGWTFESYEKINQVIVDKIAAIRDRA